MSTFTRHELLSLDPDTLRGLLDLAEGDNVLERSRYLGLDPFNQQTDYDAVRAAVPELTEGTQPFSPPIGAAHPGVRSDLTPTAAAMAPLGVDLPGPLDDGSDDLLPPANAEAAATMEQMLSEAAGTGRPFMAGTFALYSDPSGAVVMVTETSMAGVRRDVIPRKAVRFALSMIGGGAKRSMIGKLLGRG